MEQQQKWQFKKHNIDKERKDLKVKKKKNNATINQIREKLKGIQQETTKVLSGYEKNLEDLRLKSNFID